MSIGAGSNHGCNLCALAILVLAIYGQRRDIVIKFLLNPETPCSVPAVRLKPPPEGAIDHGALKHLSKPVGALFLTERS